MTLDDPLVVPATMADLDAYLRERIMALQQQGPRTPIGDEVTCVGCGCSNRRACPGGCWWVQPGLCSQCASVRLGDSYTGPAEFDDPDDPAEDSDDD